MENPLESTQFMHLKFTLTQKSGQSKIFSLNSILKDYQELLLKASFIAPYLSIF